MNENATFIIHQGVCNVKHPFDLQADNIGGIFRRKDQVCLYETVRNDGKETSLSSEVHVEKENGKVIGDKINSKMCGKWEQREASLKNVCCGEEKSRTQKVEGIRGESCLVHNVCNDS